MNIDNNYRVALNNRQIYMRSYYQQHQQQVHYLSYYHGASNQPRDPPQLFMWPTESIGQIHKIRSKHKQW